MAKDEALHYRYNHVIANKMNQILIMLLIYAPVAFAVAEIYLSLNLYGPGMPFVRLTRLEEGLERRGLLGDAAVGLLAHLVVWRSSEYPVRALAKGFYGVYLIVLLLVGPATLLLWSRTDPDEAAQIIRVEQVQRNGFALFCLALVNFLGYLRLIPEPRGEANDPVLGQLRAPGEPGFKWWNYDGRSAKME